jgi:hypothetical protein
VAVTVGMPMLLALAATAYGTTIVLLRVPWPAHRPVTVKPWLQRGHHQSVLEMIRQRLPLPLGLLAKTAIGDKSLQRVAILQHMTVGASMMSTER